jgi:hypothetical protein
LLAGDGAEGVDGESGDREQKHHQDGDRRADAAYERHVGAAANAVSSRRPGVRGQGGSSHSADKHLQKADNGR